MSRFLTQAAVEAKILATEYFYSGTLTLCVLTLENGFKVSGQSACVDPELYNANLGQFYAYEDAARKIWELEAYLLKEQLYREALA